MQRCWTSAWLDRYASAWGISRINSSGLSRCCGWQACQACVGRCFIFSPASLASSVTDGSPTRCLPFPLCMSILKAPVAVSFYTFFSCPFCPIVLARLQALQKQMGFTLKMIDVTLNPQTLVTKGIRSVPVVEVGEHRLVGNSTTEQLAALIARGQAPELFQAS